jgi:hypothetical protein
MVTRYFLAFSLGLLCAIFGLILDQVTAVSREGYWHLFAVAAVCDFVAAICFVYVLQQRSRWRFAVTALTLIILYTIMDFSMRLFFGVRVLYPLL